jgi:hypothetical protein
MSLWTDREGRQWVDEARHCWSPQGHLLSWCSSLGKDTSQRHMYRLGHKPLTDDEGEELRRRWGGSPD